MTRQPARVGEVLDEIDDLAEEAAVLFHLSSVLREFESRTGQSPPRRVLVDGRWVTPRRHIIARAHRLLAEKSLELRDRARDLQLLEVTDAPEPR